MYQRVAEFVLGLCMGALLGAILALLFAPFDGTKMRLLLLDQGHSLQEQGAGALTSSAHR